MQSHNNIDSILRLPEVMKRTGLSRSTIYVYIEKGLFPKPIKIGLRAVGWYASEVNQWILSRSKIGETANG